MNRAEPYSRAAFDAIVAKSRAADPSAGGVLAGLAVGLGVVQLLFWRWAELRLAERTATAIGGAAFITASACCDGCDGCGGLVLAS